MIKDSSYWEELRRSGSGTWEGTDAGLAWSDVTTVQGLGLRVYGLGWIV